MGVVIRTTSVAMPTVLIKGDLVSATTTDSKGVRASNSDEYDDTFRCRGSRSDATHGPSIDSRDQHDFGGQHRSRDKGGDRDIVVVSPSWLASPPSTTIEASVVRSKCI